MAYSREIYDAVQQELERRRLRAQMDAEERHNRVRRQYPRVRELEMIIAQSAGKLVAAIADKDNYEQRAAVIRRENQQAQAELQAILQASSETYKDFQPHYTCETCGDTGYAGTKACDCRKALLRNEAMRRFRDSVGMKTTSFDDLDMAFYDTAYDDRLGCSPREHMQSVIEYCRWYAQSFDTARPSLLLRGATGTGKTHVSLSIAAVACENGASVMYGPVQRFLHDMEADHFGRASTGIEKQLLECDLLVIDDLGTEFSTPFYTSALYTIINGRLVAGRPTIISTNLDAAAIYDRYGEQITSRLIGTYEPMMFVGSDIRQQQLKRRLAADR